MSQIFILTFVGKAAALGLAIDIPILVRSLADSLASDLSIGPLKFHESLLTTLDNSLDADHPCALVPEYVGNGKGWGNPRGSRVRVCAGTGTGNDSPTRKLSNESKNIFFGQELSELWLIL